MTSEICQKYDKRAVYYNKNWRIKYFQNNLNIVVVTSLLNVVIVIFFLYVYNLGYRYHVRVMFSSVVIRKACFIWTFTRILNIQKNNVCNLTNTIGLGLAINKKISISPKSKFYWDWKGVECLAVHVSELFWEKVRLVGAVTISKVYPKIIPLATWEEVMGLRIFRKNSTANLWCYLLLIQNILFLRLFQNVIIYIYREREREWVSERERERERERLGYFYHKTNSWRQRVTMLFF